MPSPATTSLEDLSSVPVEAHETQEVESSYATFSALQDQDQLPAMPHAGQASLAEAGHWTQCQVMEADREAFHARVRQDIQ